MSLVFLVQADLKEIQRERFVTSMSLRQIDMAQYTYLQVKQLFMELFCTTRTGTADPTIRHVKRSTFSLFLKKENAKANKVIGWSRKKPAKKVLSAFLLRAISGCWVRREATRENVFLIDDLNKEKEKTVEANNEKDLAFDQGPITKARAISQMNHNSQRTKCFTERKAVRKVARKEVRKTRTRLNPPRKASPPRATLHHLYW